MKNGECKGTGYPVGGPYYAQERRGKRVTCPECGKDLAASFRSLGTRGSGCGFEAVVPRHVRPAARTPEPSSQTPGQSITTGLKEAVEWAGTVKRCGCGAPLAFATGIGEYCTAGFKCTEASGLQKQTTVTVTYGHGQLQPVAGVPVSTSPAPEPSVQHVVREIVAMARAMHADAPDPQEDSCDLLADEIEERFLAGNPQTDMTALLDRLTQNPRAFRLTDLETREVWAFTVRDGKLVPVREVVPR